MCTQQAPGQKECDNALRELEVTTIVQSIYQCVKYSNWFCLVFKFESTPSWIPLEKVTQTQLRCMWWLYVLVCLQSVRGMLENPTEAVSELSYFDCIDSVMENSKVLLPSLPSSSFVSHLISLLAASFFTSLQKKIFFWFSSYAAVCASVFQFLLSVWLVTSFIIRNIERHNEDIV